MPIRIRTRWTPFLRAGTPRRLPSSSRTRCWKKIPAEKRAGLIQALCQNPRPGYQHDPTRRYGFLFSGFDVRFTIDEDTLRVVEVAENACEPADI